MKLKVLILTVACLILHSCTQTSLLQDARTEGKGNGSMAAVLSAYGTTEASDVAAVVPFLYVQGSYGLAERVDLQLSFSSGGNILLSPKVQVVGDRSSKFALSLNPGFEYQIGSDDGNLIYRTQLGFIASVHPSKKLAIFLEPKLISQFTDQDRFNFPGATLGVKFPLGDRFDLSIGGGLFQVRNIDDGINDAVLYNFGLGGRYRFLKK